jgi:hypothetical protein
MRVKLTLDSNSWGSKYQLSKNMRVKYPRSLVNESPTINLNTKMYWFKITDIQLIFQNKSAMCQPGKSGVMNYNFPKKSAMTNVLRPRVSSYTCVACVVYMYDISICQIDCNFVYAWSLNQLIWLYTVFIMVMEFWSYSLSIIFQFSQATPRSGKDQCIYVVW